MGDVYEKNREEFLRWRLREKIIYDRIVGGDSNQRDLIKLIEGEDLDVNYVFRGHAPSRVFGTPSGGTLLQALFLRRKSAMLLLRYLLENGANPNVANEHGQTPIQMALRDNLIDSVELLLSYGANINHAPSQSRGILEYAFDSGYSVTMFALRNGADMNVRFKTSRCPCPCFSHAAHTMNRYTESSLIAMIHFAQEHNEYLDVSAGGRRSDCHSGHEIIMGDSYNGTLIREAFEDFMKEPQSLFSQALHAVRVLYTYGTLTWNGYSVVKHNGNLYIENEINLQGEPRPVTPVEVGSRVRLLTIDQEERKVWMACRNPTKYTYPGMHVDRSTYPMSRFPRYKLKRKRDDSEVVSFRYIEDTEGNMVQEPVKNRRTFKE